MTDQERTIITAFLQRVAGVAPVAQGSVPSLPPALPPVDPAADQLIGALFERYPEARYRLTQLAFVQEHALTEAQARIGQLQNLVQQLQARLGAQPPAPQGGIFQSLFGAGRGPAGPPQPGYAPPMAPGPAQFQQRGGGFLGSALTTAAGVAGGLVAGNALMDLFGAGHGFGGGAGLDPGGAFSGGAGGSGAGGSAWDNLTENSQPAGWDAGGQGGGQDGAAWDNSGSAGGTGAGSGTF